MRYSNKAKIFLAFHPRIDMVRCEVSRVLTCRYHEKDVSTDRSADAADKSGMFGARKGDGGGGSATAHC